MNRGAAAKLLACAALLALAAAAHAQPALTLDLGSGPIHVGDHVPATLTLRVGEPLSGEPRFPAWSGNWGDAEIVSAGAVERMGDGVYRQQLVLAPFATGALKLPPQTVEVPLASGTVHLQTPAGGALEVASLLPAGDAKPEPKPPTPPQALPVGERFWWTAGIGAALCLLAVGLLYARRGSDAGAAEPVLQPALEPLPELLLELDALIAAGAASGAASTGEPAHTRLSLALRRFLGRVLGIHALESSTSEIRAALREHGLPRGAAGEVLEVLRACDGVKFARRPATGAEAAARLERTRQAATTIADALLPPPLPNAESTAAREART